MDPRLGALARYVAEIRQDWSLTAVQRELGGLSTLPYRAVAMGALLAATDPTAERVGEIGRAARRNRSVSGPTPPPLCARCRWPHEPEKPHRTREPAGDHQAGAAAARAGIAPLRTYAPGDAQSAEQLSEGDE